MYHTLLVIECVLAFAVTALVLLQPTDGGALGIGESEGLLKGQAISNPLVQITVIVGGLFFVTCLGVSVAQRWSNPNLLGQEEQPLTQPSLNDSDQPKNVPSSVFDHFDKP